jgi:hypothetical protein
MLKLYDYLDEILAIEKIQALKQKELPYYASDIMEKLGYDNKCDFDAALKRTFKILRAMQLPLNENFRQVYKYTEDGKMRTDWQVSALASFLLTLNGNPCNPNVAKAQVFLAMHLKTASN